MLPSVRNLSSLLSDSAQAFGDRPFLLSGDAGVSFAELDARADRCARGLAARGIAPGDRVAVAGLNTADWLTLFFGAVRLGAAVVTLNVRYRESELTYMLGQSGAALVVSEAQAGGFDFRSLYAGLTPRLPALRTVVWFGGPARGGVRPLLAPPRPAG